jgi:hypothetical protein
MIFELRRALCATLVDVMNAVSKRESQFHRTGEHDGLGVHNG